jgi:hypothetical protein
MSAPRHARRNRRSAKRAVVVLATIGATTTVGVGLANWSATGTSTAASETAGTTVAKQALTVSTTAPTGMYPTQTTPGSIVATVTNPNSYNVTLSGASVTGVSGCAGVAITDFTYGTAVPTTPLATKLSGATGAVSIPITLVNNTLPDTCAASSIKFDVAVTGASS